MFTSEKMVKFLREKYPPGTRIRLVSMEDPYAPVAPGTEGTLVCVDDAGQFQMKWDNGRTLALIPGEDSFTVLPPERSVLKLYMPLTAELYEPDEWGDMPEEAERLTGGELASYEDKIRSALFKNRMQEEQVRGIMYWYRKPDSVNDKVHSVVFDVEQRHGRLWGVAECQISGELSAGELAALKKYISGQASDGWGEGFEQQEITLDGGRELYVHLWQDEDWSIRTEQEQFEPYRDKLPQLCFMRRMYAYLTKHRCIDRDVVTAFVQEKLLYEDDPHHNCVFVGLDENGEARHAHLRSTSSQGKVFRINVESSDIKHSFHKNGTDRSLYVFEAPIDLLSHITLYPAGWLEHSYVACCGTSIQPVLERLRQNPKLDTVYLCLDNDEAGEDACDGMLDTLEDMGYDVERLRPEGKDWNDDLRAKRGGHG